MGARGCMSDKTANLEQAGSRPGTSPLFGLDEMGLRMVDVGVGVGVELVVDMMGLRMGGVGVGVGAVLAVGGLVGLRRMSEEECCLRPGGSTGAKLPPLPPPPQ